MERKENRTDNFPELTERQLPTDPEVQGNSNRINTKKNTTRHTVESNEL